MHKPEKPVLTFILFLFSISLFCCKSGTVNLFKPRSPHETYKNKLVNAGLDKTAMGSSWIEMAGKSMQTALSITVPFRETGYFAPESVSAVAYRFKAVKGQRLTINLIKKPADGFMVYTDIWELPADGAPRLRAFADTLNQVLTFDVEKAGTYLIRLQPELLRGGEYTLEINSGPSLGFPVKNSAKRNIQSFFGDGRDENQRRHEGIDIFAPLRTPVIAVANGTVVKVNENNLGGKVVWMRPQGKDYTLYYAHLDQQLATDGQSVSPGDTLGLVGNTGNARTTAPHLHFGIYTAAGAVDPLPYVNPVVDHLPEITASPSRINATVRTNANAVLLAGTEINAVKLISLKPGTILHIEAASRNWYRATLPDGNTGFIQSRLVLPVVSPVRKLKVTADQQLVYDKPDSLAAVKFRLAAGESVNLLGSFPGYYLISFQGRQTGWVKGVL